MRIKQISLFLNLSKLLPQEIQIYNNQSFVNKMELLKKATKDQPVEGLQNKNIKEKESQRQKIKIYRGIFIANERRKGRGGRIKSTSISNKIQVQMKRDVGYLHQTEVEWIQVSRFRKQGKKKKRQDKKHKYKLKDVQNTGEGIQKKKYILKEQKQTEQIKQPNQNSRNTGIENSEMLQCKSKSQEVLHCQIESKKQQQSIQHIKQQQLKQNEEQISSESSLSQDQKEKDDNGDIEIENAQKNEKNEQKQEQQDIIIVAQIKKEISNPFWKKPFVGVLKFSPVSGLKPKYKEKDVEKSHIMKILDDFYLDFQPINPRLPISEMQRTNSSQKLLEEYVEKNIIINPNQKGGKIRNKILDQFQCLYALIKFNRWHRGRSYVNLIKIIGKARTIEGQCNCFLYEHEFNNFEYEEGEQRKTELQLNISTLHKSYEQMVFTIDPVSSVDLDDALSINRIEDNIYQLGIHISDVSSYLNEIPRSQIVKRTTSVYLPNFTYHMLPEYLVKICSLNPGVKRLAFTVFVCINKEGEVLSSRIQKNVLASRFKLSYQQAQSIINDQINYEQFNKLHLCTLLEYEILVDKLKAITKIGLAHRQKRLTFQIFNNEEMIFEFDQQNWPINFSFHKRLTSQNIVEQCMIIANIQAAKKSIQQNPKNSLIIHHPPPTDFSIRQFNQYFQFLNYKLKFQNSYSLQTDLLKIEKMQNINEDIKKLCFFKAKRIQETATYKKYIDLSEMKGKLHFALGLKYYTHFTSPMRRVADILVHQALNHGKDTHIDQFTLLDSQIQLANWGRQGTKKLRKDLTQIYLCLMVYRTKKPLQTEGIISAFRKTSVQIFIPMLDMNKEFMWKDFDIDKVFNNRQDAKKLDVVLHYDKRDAKKDIIWILEKFAKIPIKVNCSSSLPLKINLELEVKTNKGTSTIKPRLENY